VKQNKDKDIQVVILCGGIGTRLKEQTEYRPKPMVRIGDKPILWHIMKIYSSFGYNDFVLALGYRGDIIKNYFYHYELLNNDVTIELGKPENIRIHQNLEESGWKVTLAYTGDKALKGARIKRIEKYIAGDTFMMTYGDGIANIDIGALLAFHRSHGRMATVTGINPASRFGELKTNGGMVKSFREKPRDNNGLIKGGFFVFKKGIFDSLSVEDDCDFEFGPLEQIANEGQLMVYKHKGFWACMDTIRDMEYLNKLWSENKAIWKTWE